LLEEYWPKLQNFLEDNWERIFDHCKEPRVCFKLRGDMSKVKTAPSRDMLLQLMNLLPRDENDDRSEVAQLRRQLIANIGINKIGPIFLSNTRNGDNRWNYAESG